MEAFMPLKKFGLASTSGLSAASLFALSGAVSLALADNYHQVRHGHRVAGASYHHFSNYRPLYGYYTRQGQYVPGAGDRLIYGSGYVFVPGHGILDEACNLPSSTCTNEYRDVR